MGAAGNAGGRGGVLLLSLFVLAMISVLVLAACGSVKTPTEPPAPTTGTAFTFSRVQAEIFTPNCAKAGCHDAAAASGGMVLAAGRAYGEIVGRSAQGRPDLHRIEPGDPQRSYMIKKLRGDADIVGSQMPLDAPGSLPRAELDGLIGWILAGAPNN
jgi:hypothetical protein